jgi:hypothetical protein
MRMSEQGYRPPSAHNASDVWDTHIHSYQSAKTRCTNPNHVGFAHYGERGIRFLCNSFEGFFRDVGERPPDSTLERCDNHGHYEPGNCRWTTPIEQANNRRTNRTLTAFGRTRTLARWAREFSINPNTLSYRLEKGWSSEKALTEPDQRLLRNRDAQGRFIFELKADGVAP